MSNVEVLKSELIDKILSLNNEDLLRVIDRIITEIPISDRKISLSSQQKEVLKMSDEDIISGRFYSETDADNHDQELLN